MDAAGTGGATAVGTLTPRRDPAYFCLYAGLFWDGYYSPGKKSQDGFRLYISKYCPAYSWGMYSAQHGRVHFSFYIYTTKV